MKKIFIFNDGTGQNTLTGHASNVARIFNSLSGAEVSSSQYNCDIYKICLENNYHALYFEGVGSDELKKKEESSNFWGWLARKFKRGLEIVEGSQVKEKVENSLADLEKIWRAGDEIYLIGFSRGAASIRILAKYIPKAIPGADVKYMLVYDTVYSVASPIKIRDYEEIKYFENTDISSHVKKCDHLISGDEMRSKFPLTSMNMRENVRQILFSGCHSDVGGGLKGRGLADISLKFSLNEFQLLGIKFADEGFKKLNLQPNAMAEIGWDTFAGTGQSHSPRDFKDIHFLIHKSVHDRCAAGGSAPIALASLTKFSFGSADALIDKKHITVNF
ncbi:MAG: DUF2235 domain-containing protein [Pseudobdellovibrio sp.]|nr:DUF2235 domain-containing protein [Pseudobdellovibrio sp.]